MFNKSKMTLLVIAVFLFNLSVCLAEGEVTLLESDSKSRAHLNTETVWVTNDDSELIDYCRRVFGKDEAALKAVRLGKKVDFDYEVLIFVIGKDSYQGYEITFLSEATDYSKGMLNIYFKVSRPTDDQLKQGRRTPHYNKNPYLILKTNAEKLKLNKIERINFIDVNTEELLDSWSNE